MDPATSRSVKENNPLFALRHRTHGPVWVSWNADDHPHVHSAAPDDA